jgi:uncharacterized protein (TIGR02996 family)
VLSNDAVELWAFLKALEKSPRDSGARMQFADWLDEHDRPEDAAQQRYMASEEGQKRQDAEQYMRRFCEKYGANYDELLRAVAAGEGYCFGDDDGPWAVRDDDQFWRNVEILTGAEPDRDQSFSCAC